MARMGVVLVMCLLALRSFAVDESLPDISLGELTECIKHAESLIETISLVVFTESLAWDGHPESNPGSRVDSPLKPRRFYYKRKGAPGTMEYWSFGEINSSDEKAPLPRFSGAYNGEFQTWYTEIGRQQERYGQSGIIGHRDTMPMHLPPTFGSRRFQGQLLSDFLSACLVNPQVSILMEREVIDGVPAYRLQTGRFLSHGRKEKDEYTGPWHRIWVAPQYGFHIVRAEKGHTDVGASESVEDHTEWRRFEEVSPQIWHPRESLTYEHVRSPPYVIKNTVESIAVNTPIPDSDFTLKFPGGTHVEDRRSGTDFVVPYADAEVEAKVSVIVETARSKRSSSPSGAALAAPPSGSDVTARNWNRGIVLVGLALAVGGVGGAALLVLRRRRKRVERS